MLVNVVRAIIILLVISFSDLPSSVSKLPRYILYDGTCSICCPSMAIFVVLHQAGIWSAETVAAGYSLTAPGAPSPGPR